MVGVICISSFMFRKILSLFIYVIFFVVIPFYIIYSNRVGKNQYSPFLDYLSFYILFIAPLLFIIPYKLAKLKTILEKLLFVLFGFIIPFAIIYFYAYLDYQENFHPGF